MKKIKSILFGLISILLFSLVQAQQISLGDFLTQYFNWLWADLPQSYQYIEVEFTNIPTGTQLYQAIQKAIYMNAFPNSKITLPYQKNISETYASKIILNSIGHLVPADDQPLTQERLDQSIKHITKFNLLNKEKTSLQETIMQDVYQTLKTKYYDTGKVNDEALSYGAIKGLVNAIHDPHTKFFPPQEANNFNQEMEGKYEGIGVYITMPTPWNLTIVSIINGSPAQKAWLQAWDKITHINDQAVTIYNNITDITQQIKGKIWTTITLDIQRTQNNKTTTLKIPVTRAHIDVKDINTDFNNINSCIIQLNSFDYNIYNNFLKAAQEAKDKQCKNFIIDLRNNPWGSLNAVASILDHFVPAWQNSIIVKTQKNKESYQSEWIDTDMFFNKKIAILINQWSASASEILAWTIKDYLPHVALFGEKSFGKWTVQKVINYQGGSMLKYTIAKRFTGKSQTNIDGTWITPDYIISDNPKTERDEQLETAKKRLAIPKT